MVCWGVWTVGPAKHQTDAAEDTNPGTRSVRGSSGQCRFIQYSYCTATCASTLYFTIASDAEPLRPPRLHRARVHAQPTRSQPLRPHTRLFSTIFVFERGRSTPLAVDTHTSVGRELRARRAAAAAAKIYIYVSNSTRAKDSHARHTTAVLIARVTVLCTVDIHVGRTVSLSNRHAKHPRAVFTCVSSACAYAPPGAPRRAWCRAAQP